TSWQRARVLSARDARRGSPDRRRRAGAAAASARTARHDSAPPASELGRAVRAQRIRYPAMAMVLAMASGRSLPAAQADHMRTKRFAFTGIRFTAIVSAGRTMKRLAGMNEIF